MVCKADYFLGLDKITLRKDNHFRIRYILFCSLFGYLIFIGIFIWVLLDHQVFNDSVRSQALWIFPLASVFMILADFLSAWVLKKSGKEIVVINAQGIRIEGRKGQGEIKKETIQKLTFQTNLVNKCCLIQISTGSSRPIGVDDVAIPKEDVERVEKACKAMLGLQ